MATPGVSRHGLFFILSSPSGAGKTAISRAILESDDDISLSISVTTRPKRPAETDGVDYIFVDHARFEEMVAEDAFLEHATVFGNRYGTPRSPVETALAAGRDVMFDVDWQGAQKLAELARADLVGIFVLPPSTAELERRLKGRAQDSEDVVAERMAQAADEMRHWAEYDYVIVNEDLDTSVASARAILRAERLRRHRLVGLDGFVKNLSQAP